MLADKTIKKHVALIHAYSLMTVLQRKIVNLLLYEAIHSHHQLNHQDSVAIECVMPLSVLYKAVNFNSNNTQYLREAIDKLASLKIEWNLLKDKVPTNISFLNLRVLHGPPTFYQDNTLNFSFHKVMLDLVEHPAIYGTIDLDLQTQFESKYSHSLYENSTRFVNLEKNKIIPLETFKKLLGVPENKYASMRELKRNVINPSLTEVNDRAEFVVNLEEIKSGRKVTGFEWSVNSKKKGTKITSKIDVRSLDIANKIQETFVISATILNKILQEYSEAYILEKINYTKKHLKPDNKGYYSVAYFISALRDDYKEKETISEKPALISIETENQTQLTNLYADLEHWKKMHNYLCENNATEGQLGQLNTVIKQCEEKIKQHLIQISIKDQAD